MACAGTQYPVGGRYMCSHRHQIFCILPPHILVEIAKNGTPEQRDFALRALDIDNSVRTSRLTFSLLGGLQVPHVEAAATATPQKQRTIYDAKHNQSLPGQLVRAEGQAEV